MFFISKKKFENEVRSRVEQELCKMEERRYRADEIRDVHRRCEMLERRLEKIEAMHNFSTNLTASPTVY